jgi:hypothetical protein
MISPISDGQPITYDLLNQIISEVNRATSSIYTDEVKQIVQVFGEGIGRKEDDKAVIAVGSVSVNLKGRTATIDTVKFPNNVGFDRIPYVSLTLVDPQGGRAGAGINFANLAVTQLSKESFKIKVDLATPVQSPTIVNVHYIAIGPQSSA